MPDLFGCIGRTTPRVNSDNHGFHVVIFSQILQIFAHVVAYNLAIVLENTLWRRLVDNVSVGIVDGNMLSRYRCIVGVDVVNCEFIDIIFLVYS